MEGQLEPAVTNTGRSGCGPIMIFVIILVIIASMFGINEALGYYFENCGDEQILDCMLHGYGDSGPDKVKKETVTATGVYSFEDYSVTVTANIPLEGGDVSGSISGTCGGKLKGKFSGKNNGVISGKIAGSCSPFFINIPASAEFNGVVNKDSQQVPISFTGKGAGLTHEGSMSLNY